MHDMLLAEHGGIPGIRSREELEDAPKVAQAFYPNVAVTAALYAITIVRRRPFFDANKRVAFLAFVTFLELHTHRLNAYAYDAIEQIDDLASPHGNALGFINWSADHAFCMQDLD